TGPRRGGSASAGHLEPAYYPMMKKASLFHQSCKKFVTMTGGGAAVPPGVCVEKSFTRGVAEDPQSGAGAQGGPKKKHPPPGKPSGKGPPLMTV
ncbi:MAG: hypothetical protein LBG10_08725, partial [Treponema sp.]|nr:hypothetical protein [Treponema sp.]